MSESPTLYLLTQTLTIVRKGGAVVIVEEDDSHGYFTERGQAQERADALNAAEERRLADAYGIYLARRKRRLRNEPRQCPLPPATFEDFAARTRATGWLTYGAVEFAAEPED